ncbi:5183_t:CDS:1, partial [Racocetra persica]
PTASDILSKLKIWYGIIKYAPIDKDELAILKAFQSADTIIPTLSIELPICPKDKLT